MRRARLRRLRRARLRHGGRPLCGGGWPLCGGGCPLCRRPLCLPMRRPLRLRLRCRRRRLRRLRRRLRRIVLDLDCHRLGLVLLTGHGSPVRLGRSLPLLPNF